MSKLKTLLVVSIALAGFAATQPFYALLPARADNVLRNGGFEEGLVGWQHAREGRVVEGREAAHSGEHAARLRFDDSFWQAFPCAPTTWYEVSGHVRREKPNGLEVPKLKIGFRTAEDKPLGAMAHQIFDVTTRYQRFSFGITPPRGTATINLVLVGQFQGSEWFYYDDVEVLSHPLRDMPSWKDTPDLNNKTVVPVPIADVRSFALYLWEPAVSDGGLATSCTTRRADYVRNPPAMCNFDVTLDSGITPNCVLVHSLAPRDIVRNASLYMTTGGRGFDMSEPLVEVRHNEDCVVLRPFRGAVGNRLRLQVVNPPGKESAVNEIQLLNLRNTQHGDFPAESSPLSAQEPLPPDYRSHLETCFALPGDRRTLVVGKTEGSGTIDLPACQYLSVLSDPCKEETGVEAVRLRLKLTSAGPENVLEICVKRPQLLDLNPYYASYKDRGVDLSKLRDPKHYQQLRYSDTCRVYTRLGGASAASKVDVVLDLPDAMLLPGERIWVTLRTLSPATLDLAGSGLAVRTATTAAVAKEFLPSLLRMTRGLYAFSTEAHVYGNPDSILNQYMQRVLRSDPDNPLVETMVRRITGRKVAVDLKSPGPAGAPEWAVWGREALRNYLSIVRWWIENRQVENGEFGGDINDDVELTCQWPFLYLITGDKDVKEALRRISDAAWERNLGTGYSVGMSDVEHAAEEILCSQPQMLLADYGNPEYIERLMLTSSYIPEWTGLNERGERLFRSFDFKPGYINTQPQHDVDNTYCALVMAAPYYLSWYAGNPQPRGWFLEWARTWARKSTGAEGSKPAGAIPCDIQFLTGKVAPYTKSWQESIYGEGASGSYCTRQALLASYFVSGDKEMLSPFDYEPNASAFDGMGLYWRRITGDTRHDAAMVKRADDLLASYTAPLMPPPSGPEVRVTVEASKALQVASPMRLETYPGAPVDQILFLPKDAPFKSGSAVYEVEVTRPGLYAACALAFAESLSSSACTAKVDESPTAMLSAQGLGRWTWAVSNQPKQLQPGLHRITVYGRHPGFRIARVGLTTHYSTQGNWDPLGFPFTDVPTAYAYLATGKKDYVTEQLKEVNRESVRQRWLLTEAGPATDRVPIPGARLLAFMYLGGCAGGPKAGYPYLAVSYEGGGTDFAAFVLENEPTRCKLLLYSFGPKPKPLTVRFWGLVHGQYELTMGPDANGDDAMDSVGHSETIALRRYDGVKLALAPQQLQVVEARQVKELEPPTTRPDLALSAKDVRVSSEARTITIVVHNVGAAPVALATLRVIRNGKTLALGGVHDLRAPTELRPATKTLTLKLSAPAGAQAFSVELDPEDRVREITEVNNRVVVRK